MTILKKETVQMQHSDGQDINKKASNNYRTFNPNSQCGELLAMLKQGHSVTHYDALKLGIMAFHSRIQDLRNGGYSITCTMETHTNKRGLKVKYGRYSLDKLNS